MFRQRMLAEGDLAKDTCQRMNDRPVVVSSIGSGLLAAGSLTLS
jgi:hypothetical protein